MELLSNGLVIIGYLGLIYSLFQWLYYHKLNFFLWVNKVFSFKKDVNFELTISAKRSKYDIDNISKYFRENLDTESKVIGRSKTKVSFTLDSLVIQISKDELDESGFEIDIFIKSTNSSYRLAKKNLHKIGIVLEKLRNDDVLKPNKYQFVSSFEKKNPFIGPSVSTIKFDNIKNFIMVLSSNTFSKVTFENNNDIQVGLRNVSYVDTNYSDVKLVAEIILAI